MAMLNNQMVDSQAGTANTCNLFSSGIWWGVLAAASRWQGDGVRSPMSDVPA